MGLYISGDCSVKLGMKIYPGFTSDRAVRSLENLDVVMEHWSTGIHLAGPDHESNYTRETNESSEA